MEVGARQQYSNGIRFVEASGQWGFIDKTGKFVIEPQFDDVRDFQRGLASVCIAAAKFRNENNPFGCLDRSSRWGYVNQEGKIVWMPKE